MTSPRILQRSTFISEWILEERFTCASCQKPYENPHIISKCQHVFCQTCLDSRDQCFICDSFIQAKHLKRADDIIKEIHFVNKMLAYEHELFEIMSQTSKSNGHQSLQIEHFASYLRLENRHVSLQEKTERMSMLIFKYCRTLGHSKTPNSPVITYYDEITWSLGVVREVQKEKITIDRHLHDTEVISKRTPHKCFLFLTETLMAHLLSEEGQGNTPIELAPLSQRIIQWYDSQLNLG
jgi:hypothetical protein